MAEANSFDEYRLLFEERFSRLDTAVTRIEAVVGKIERDMAVLQARAALIGGMAAIAIEVGIKILGH